MAFENCSYFQNYIALAVVTGMRNGIPFIKTDNNDEWALPGGYFSYKEDFGEPSLTATRHLIEQTGILTEEIKKCPFYAGKVFFAANKKKIRNDLFVFEAKYKGRGIGHRNAYNFFSIDKIWHLINAGRIKSFHIPPIEFFLENIKTKKDFSTFVK